uniref:Uncharacterized protein n=1 Tax=Rhinella marina erythrocytic-like virus TaxID=2859906 RepID=A0A8F6YHX9_9VIRU|nr:hypothetical protein RMELV021 [Rhinella marina erythrocytic-like virus]
MNTQKRIAVGLVILIIIIVMIILWYTQVIKFPKLSAPTSFNSQYLYPPADTRIQSEGPYADAEISDEHQDIYIDSEDIIIEDDTATKFKPLISKDTYAQVSLAGDVTKYASSGMPLPNMSLYNVNTQSYITGLGDPIRGDLDIEPRNSNMYKTQFSPKDARLSALTSIA